MLHICNICFYISFLDAFLFSHDNPVFQIYTPSVLFYSTTASYILPIMKESHSYIGARTIGIRTIGMRIIGMEDNWHAENWHGGQLVLIF